MKIRTLLLIIVLTCPQPFVTYNAAWAQICLSPSINVSQQFFRGIFIVKSSEFKFYQKLLKQVRDFTNGGCRTASVNLAVIIQLRGEKTVVLGVNDSHVWVETDQYILDPMPNGHKDYYKEPETQRLWEATGGVIVKGSYIAQRFYQGVCNCP